MISARRWATNAANKSQFNVFDRAVKTIQRLKPSLINVEESRKVEYVKNEVAKRTIERLAFVTRDFTRTLDLGSGSGNFYRELCSLTPQAEEANEEEQFFTQQYNTDKATIRNKIKELVMVDSAAPLLNRDNELETDFKFPGQVKRIATDEEEFSHPELETLDQFDVVISNLALHWINDLPQALKNINRVLKPDGLFMASIVGGDTLYELRTSLQLAELERKGGISPRVSPLVHLNDVGSLMNRAGFNMLTIDSEDIVIGGFPNIAAICEELQQLGEQNAVLLRATHLPRDVLLAANEIYKSLHGETDEHGVTTLPATFSVIFIVGWKKSDDQPQPLARGSGQVSLKDALGLEGPDLSKKK